MNRYLFVHAHPDDETLATGALIVALVRAGNPCAVVTATNSFVTGAIAREFGIPHLIGTVAAVDVENGAFSGAPTGMPSFREGKIARVHQWLAEQGHTLSDFDASIFYSDSTNDLPLLELVSEPVATNPSPALEAIALQRGWRILRLFP